MKTTTQTSRSYKNPASLAVGDRVHWAGDHSNKAMTGTVTELDGVWMFVRWDGEERAKPSLRAILSTPRWRVLDVHAA